MQCEINVSENKRNLTLQKTNELKILMKTDQFEDNVFCVLIYFDACVDVMF